MYKNFLKRIIDFILAVIGVLVLSPVFLAIAIIIKCTSKGPVFFKQKRVGQNKKFFTILKFRTMYIETPKDMPTHLLDKPDAFITPPGKFLRKTSLDEIPQMFNIIAGQMAVIGPRPALWNQDDLVAERDKYGANALRPGLTGLAQISGRDELEIPEKAKVDGDYAAAVSFGLDFKIFFKTIFKVLKREGIKEGK